MYGAPVRPTDKEVIMYNPYRAEPKWLPGSCVVSGHGTDTVISINGTAEALVAGLIVLGVPSGEAAGTALAAIWSLLAPGIVPVGRQTVRIRVCADCFARSAFARQGISPVVYTVGAQVPTLAS